ncbi:folliculin-interacting protein N-terminus-domain-containing protein [Coniella lustricola]|uniref:Folliculin-interacting protein N-terminus-domain-containing protein n=1 Tax=Coniella lustricola TaxID=2025994 RepID=A0A2T2ZWN4_9PEZI|nr:folliculin-interacting protein N-terminus-domain-containing protein [Coniella lustricola]
MLGKLFSLSAAAAGGAPAPAHASSSKQVSTLESVQEDIHTRCLLFPDPQALYQQHGNDQVFPMSSASAHATPGGSPFDLNGDMEIDERDVRVIIMQDTSSSSPASLLYDSQPLPASPAPSPIDRPATVAGLSHQTGMQDPRRLPSVHRKVSAGQTPRPLSIQQPSNTPLQRQSGFDRRSSVHGRTPTKAETESQRAAREYKQELDTFAGCIFGNNEFLAYKGTSTKVHVVPSEPRTDFSGFGDGRGSIGRSAARASKLSQSFSSETMASLVQTVSSPTPRPSDRKRVLITRLFPVNLPTDDGPLTPSRGQFSEDSPGFPFPSAGDDTRTNTNTNNNNNNNNTTTTSHSTNRIKKPQLKQKRTPMYAVALIVSLPQGSAHAAPPSALRSTFRGSSSYNEQQDPYSSSYSSARRPGWATAGPSLGGFDTFDSNFGTADAEDRIDAITRHWDVIMRTLSSLQSLSSAEILTLLRQTDIASPDPLPAPTSVRVSRASSNASQKAPKTNTKFVSLLPNCLADNRHVRAEVDTARARIVSGLRATRVVTGQNRWGIWREEARWVERWAGGRDQGFFFFNLLTGFLSIHKDWLQALSPSRYRRQFSMVQKMRGDDELSLPARTVIVGQDRVAARRLVFLLSAFLPANMQLSAARTQRPGTSTSFGTLSQSPPSFIVPLTKEESLRRKINRRGASRHSGHSRNASMYASANPKTSVPLQLAHLSIDSQRERRASDAVSIRTTNLSMLAAELDSRKASTPTMVPETSVPHFAVQKADSHLSRRSGSGNSAATDDLKRSLKRVGSVNSSDTQSSSRWGSVISGLWTTRRRDSATTTPPAARESLAGRDNAASMSPRKSTAPRRGSLAKMVEEAQSQAVHDQAEPVNAANDAAIVPETPRRRVDGQQDNNDAIARAPIPVERKADPNSAFDSPVKTTINEDGVIDVDVPFPDFIASFETAVSSPSSSGYLSTPGLSGLELFEQASRVTADGDMPMNVAGWLQQFHPDFILQATSPQPDLIEQVKASLRAEPTPTLAITSEARAERWVDVSSALVADSTNYTIRRIRYRRLVRPKTAADKSTPLLSSSVNTMNSSVLTPMVSPYEHPLQEEFIDDPIVTLDDTLIEAVERVLAQGDLGKDSSQSSSRSASKRRETPFVAQTTEQGDARNTGEPQLRTAAANREVPRGECKAVVLSALEHIAKDVVNDRDDEEARAQTKPGSRQGRDKDSVLREAVRAWVEEVDAGMEAMQ